MFSIFYALFCLIFIVIFCKGYIINIFLEMSKRGLDWLIVSVVYLLSKRVGKLCFFDIYKFLFNYFIVLFFGLLGNSYWFFLGL